MKIRTTLVVDIESDIDDDPENNEGSVRFLVEEDLSDLGYIVHKCEVRGME